MTNTSKASKLQDAMLGIDLAGSPGNGAWTYNIVAGDITNDAREFNIKPEPADFAALADALDVLAVHKLQASMRLHRTKSSIRVRGEVEAIVDQSCVVTLEPVQQKLREEIDRTFVSTREDVERVFKKMNSNREMMIDPDEIDPPEIIQNGRLDLAAVALEHVVLGIDLYPRADSADASGTLVDTQKTESLEPAPLKESPFAALAQLKKANDGTA